MNTQNEMMPKATKNRKRRTDRNYVIYKLTCKPTGEIYIGLVVATGRAFKRSVKNRFRGHTRDALEYGREAILSDAIRDYGVKSFKREVVEIVRSKKAAHAYELGLIKGLQPELNMMGK